MLSDLLVNALPRSCAGKFALGFKVQLRYQLFNLDHKSQKLRTFEVRKVSTTKFVRCLQSHISYLRFILIFVDQLM